LIFKYIIDILIIIIKNKKTFKKVLTI